MSEKYFVGGALDNPPAPIERPSDRLTAVQIERAAEALRDYECQHLDGVVKWKHLNEKIKQHFRGKVRVVVDAVGSEG